LNVHHVLPFHLKPELELDPSNLITLCSSLDKNCHLDIGHGDNFRAYNASVREYALRISKGMMTLLEAAKLAKTFRRFEISTPVDAAAAARNFDNASTSK
jgi:hypothetical protein